MELLVPSICDQRYNGLILNFLHRKGVVIAQALISMEAHPEVHVSGGSFSTSVIQLCDQARSENYLWIFYSHVPEWVRTDGEDDY